MSSGVLQRALRVPPVLRPRQRRSVVASAHERAVSPRRRRRGICQPFRCSCFKQYELYSVQHVSFSNIRHCLSAERERRRWARRHQTATADVNLTSAHMTTIDCVRIYRQPSTHRSLLFAGSRDRNISIFDLERAKDAGLHGEQPLADATANCMLHTFKAHDGWVWSIAQQTDDVHRFVSCGFDCHINQWQMGEDRVANVARVSQPVAILSVVTSTRSPHELLSTSFDGLLRVYDVRTLAAGACHAMRTHTQATPACVVDDDLAQPYVYTAGDDRRVVCVDRRMLRVLTERSGAPYALHPVAGICARAPSHSPSAIDRCGTRPRAATSAKSIRTPSNCRWRM